MRITFSIPTPLGAAARLKAKQDRRSISAYMAGLVEVDVQKAGLLAGGDHAELIAYAEQLGAPRALSALRREARVKGGRK